MIGWINKTIDLPSTSYYPTHVAANKVLARKIKKRAWEIKHKYFDWKIKYKEGAPYSYYL